MAFQSLQHVLGTLKKQEGFQGQQQFQQVLKLWPQVVGPAVMAQTQPFAIQQAVLKVATSSPVWAQNLSFERQRILAKLNAQISTPLEDIRFSTAQWYNRNEPRSGSDAQLQSAAIWRNHPSLVSDRPSQPPRQPLEPKDPQTAFKHWAEAVQQRSQNFPLCPRCQCPTPTGELKRWTCCSLCAAKDW